jgi:hypothetical protein
VIRFLLSLAALAFLLTTTALPSFADGDPWPPPTGNPSTQCSILGCTSPQ